MKLTDVFEAASTHAAEHKEKLDLLKKHGIVRDSKGYESQPGAHQSWLHGPKGKHFSADERVAIAKSLGMAAHPNAKSMGDDPTSEFFSGNHELKFGGKDDWDDTAPGTGHYVTFRTAKTARSRHVE